MARDPWDWDEQAKQEAERRMAALRLNQRFHFSDGQGKDAGEPGHDPATCGLPLLECRARQLARGTVGEEDYPPEWGIWRRTHEEGGEG